MTRGGSGRPGEGGRTGALGQCCANGGPVGLRWLATGHAGDPLHRAAGLKRLVVSTYQAVSGSGLAGVDGTEDVLANRQPIRSGGEQRGAVGGGDAAYRDHPTVKDFGLA